MSAPKKTNLRQLKKNFWELSRGKQEAFLDNLYKASSENKNIFSVWLGKEEKDKKGDVYFLAAEKETTRRIGRYKKLRVAKINEILRNAQKCPLSALQMVDLYEAIWRGTLLFLNGQRYFPERYETASVKYLQEYLERLQDIADKENQRKKKKDCKELLSKTTEQNALLWQSKKALSELF